MGPAQTFTLVEKLVFLMPLRKNIAAEPGGKKFRHF